MAKRASNQELVQSSSKRHQQVEPSGSTVIFVGDIGYEVTSQILYQAFSQFGEVTTARVAHDPIPRPNETSWLGYGFVEFAEADQARHVVEVCGSKSFFYIGGSPRPVFVEYAEPAAKRAARIPGLGPDDLISRSESSGSSLKYEIVSKTELTPLEQKYAAKMRTLLANQQSEADRLHQRHIEAQKDLFQKHQEIIHSDLVKLKKIVEIDSTLKTMPKAAAWLGS